MKSKPSDDPPSDQATADETSAQSPPSPSPSPAPSSFSLDKSRQYISALSILAVALFIGLPVWWKTTEVYRCPLPYKEINDLSVNQVSKLIIIVVRTEASPWYRKCGSMNMTVYMYMHM